MLKKIASLLKLTIWVVIIAPCLLFIGANVMTIAIIAMLITLFAVAITATIAIFILEKYTGNKKLHKEVINFINSHEIKLTFVEK